MRCSKLTFFPENSCKNYKKRKRVFLLKVNVSSRGQCWCQLSDFFPALTIGPPGPPSAAGQPHLLSVHVHTPRGPAETIFQADVL